MEKIEYSDLDKLENLPEIDGKITRLLDVLLSPDISHRDVIGLIEQNINLSAYLLKVSNTVKYTGKYGDIKNIAQALTRLGLLEVGKICLALAMKEAIPIPESLMEKHAFWEHSVQVARVTRIIVEEKPGIAVDPGTAYIAGLLHDLGKVIMGLYYPQRCREMLKEIQETQQNIFVLEKSDFGMDHGEIGGYLLNKWSFPEEIIAAVSYHHEPDIASGPFKALAQVVHLADFYTGLYGGLEPMDILPKTCSQGALSDLGFEAEALIKIVDRVKNELEMGSEMLK